ncbi:MAG: nucleotidyl transferase AbiEii/AbiGii toxin family protein [Clostridia bacterium]|nr:nucleotidyl transferase AbiEii/AbiGii toxin family protein [Clostridia bacterium]
MKLHLDRNLFKQFINKIGIETNISVDILEKDYYVCCILQELSKIQDQLQAYFKGGTVIYKILDTMNRFSEDIDLMVKVNEQLSNTQKKKAFERTAFDYNVEGLILNKEKSIKYGKSETAFYDYEIVFDIDTAPLQRAGEIQIESTSFTVSEPSEDTVIEPIIYKYASDIEKKTLKENFEVEPIKIKIIKLERMFIDKVFAAEFYYTRKEYTDTAKHIYDLCVLINNDKIKELFKNEQELKRLVGYKREEEKIRTDGVSSDIKIKDFSYLNCNFNNEFIDKFNSVQDKYIINDKYKIDRNEIKNILQSIKEKFSNMEI